MDYQNCFYIKIWILSPPPHPIGFWFTAGGLRWGVRSVNRLNDCVYQDIIQVGWGRVGCTVTVFVARFGFYSAPLHHSLLPGQSSQFYLNKDGNGKSKNPILSTGQNSHLAKLVQLGQNINPLLIQRKRTQVKICSHTGVCRAFVYNF